VTDKTPDLLAERFEANRPRLRAVAYRMLGSMTEADDVVQDAWFRLNRSDTSGVDNLGGWLTTVVARLCLDALRTRKARREEPIDAFVPDPVVTSPDDGDPEAATLLADSVGLAMLVVLEKLTPPERLAFVLHDVFAVPFEQIGPIVERSPTAARQLASRARRRVRGAEPLSRQDLAGHRRVVDAFLAASRAGDFDSLLAVLDPDVVVRADYGPGRAGVSGVTRGARAVAAQALTFRGLAPGARSVLVNGAPGFVVSTNGRPYAVLGITVRADRITRIDILADPARLARLDLTAAGGSVGEGGDA
jgi:RNA polymerase sigma factor (sigma-70 family)